MQSKNERVEKPREDKHSRSTLEVQHVEVEGKRPHSTLHSQRARQKSCAGYIQTIAYAGTQGSSLDPLLHRTPGRTAERAGPPLLNCPGS